MKRAKNLLIVPLLFVSVGYSAMASAQVCTSPEMCPIEEPDCSGDQTNPGECRAICNDGVLGPPSVLSLEQCDDGMLSDTEANRCRSDCTFPRCGDGVTDDVGYPTDPNRMPEACDDGPQNSDFEPNACRSDCTEPYCGDGIVDSLWEDCDEGAGNSDLPGSTCSTQCIIPGCGNGVLEAGELCDDGNMSDADSCTGQCRHNVCGDALIWSISNVEMCDDALQCRYDCGQNDALCGDGVVDNGEGCDDEDLNADTPDAACRTNCQPQRCGDGVVDSGEVCDMTEGCAPDCTLIVAR